MAAEKSPSPSRTYVMRIETDNFTHYAFRKFTLPERYKNDCETATWYFYTVLDKFSCGLSTFSFEDYSNLQEIKDEEIEN